MLYSMLCDWIASLMCANTVGTGNDELVRNLTEQ